MIRRSCMPMKCETQSSWSNDNALSTVQSVKADQNSEKIHF